MKINEINQPKKINEGAFLDLLLGPELASKYSKQDRHAEAERIFLDDFIDDATVSLSNGIKSGLVDPTLVGTDSPPSDETPSKPTPPPAAPSPSPSPSPSPAPAPAPSPAPSSKPSPSSRGAASEPKPTTTPTPTSASGSPIFTGAPKRADFTQAKMDLRSAIAADPRGPMIDTLSQRKMIDNIVRNGSTAQKEIEQYLKNSPSSVKNRTSESRYSKLNAIFESIVSESTKKDGAISITEYMLDWFDAYMNGVDWRAKQSIVLPAIKDVEKTYKTDQGKTALEKLGRLAFALSGPAKQPPAGAKDIQPAAAASPAPGRNINPDQLAADLVALQPREREEVLAKVKAATK